MKKTNKAAAPDPFAQAPQQRELTPAAPAENDEARQAIATINTQLSEFDRVQAGIAELGRLYKGVVFAVDTPKGMKEATEARFAIRKPRFAVEAARKAAKAPVLKLGRDIDAKAAQITTELLALENPIDAQIVVQETKEAERKADLERRIREIQGTPATCIGKSAAQLQEVLDALDALPLEDFAEYREQAAKAQFDATQQVQQLLTTAQQAERLAELERQQKAEADRKAAIESRIRANFTARLATVTMCRTSARVQALIDGLQAVEVDDSYQEFAPAAREEKARVLAELQRIRDEKKLAEEAQAKQAEAERQRQEAWLEGAEEREQRRQAEIAGAVLKLRQQDQAKCDGNHGEPRCSAAAGQCWLDDAPAAAPTADVQKPTGDGLPPGAPRIFADEPIGRTDHDRVNDEGAARLIASFGPASTPARLGPPDFDVVDAEVAKRPTDAELMRVIAAHYDVPNTIAADWLRTFDAVAALSQLSIPTT